MYSKNPENLEFPENPVNPDIPEYPCISPKIPNFSYKTAHQKIEEWKLVHSYEYFTIDSLCKDIGAESPQAKKAVADFIADQLNRKRPSIEKSGNRFPPLYKYINYELDNIPWMEASDVDDIPFSWPKGRDGSYFPFDGLITMRPTDLVVMAGTSNMGKSTLCRNIVWENMDDWNGRLTYMVNEYQPSRFKRMTMLMDWKNPLNEDGKPKFNLVRRLEDWQYAIQPDHLNVIDWISMDGDFYRISSTMKEIQKRLNSGMAVVVIQKGEGKDLGTGGQFSEHFASYYLSVDFGRLLFKKAKEFNPKYNPNGKMYGFDLAEGAYLNNLREVKKCGQCYGKGTRYDKVMGEVSCIGCSGKGWL